MAFNLGGAGAGAASGASTGAVFGPWGAAAGGVLGGLLGGFGGGDSAAKKAAAERAAAIEELRKVNPEAADAWASLQEDPRAMAAQTAALDQLSGVANQGGMDIGSIAAQRQAMDMAAAQERGQREAVMANRAARGVTGGGDELAASLVGQQGAANRNSMAGTAAAAEARQRALAAMAQSGTLAGQVRGQNQQFQANKASAANAINTFNAGARLNKANMIMGGRTGVATGYDAQAGRDMGMSAGLGAGLGALGGVVGDAAASYFGKKKPDLSPSYGVNSYGSFD